MNVTDGDEGRIEGALTQGLRLLRVRADASPISFSPPESPILFSQDDEFFTTADDQIDFEVGTADQAVAVELTADVNEIPATPSAPPPPHFAARPRSTLRDTPIQARLRAFSATNPSVAAPKCGYCSRPDGRKDTIKCIVCQSSIHSVSCAGFSSHREAQYTAFTCRRCFVPPTLHLPRVSTPRVANNPPASDAIQANEYFPVDASFLSAPSLPTVWSPRSLDVEEKSTDGVAGISSTLAADSTVIVGCRKELILFV